MDCFATLAMTHEEKERFTMSPANRAVYKTDNNLHYHNVSKN